MEGQITNFAGMRGIYRVRIADLPRVQDSVCEHSVWDKLLGVATMVVVSAGGWIGILELIRLLK
jgi:hypothetical protein